MFSLVLAPRPAQAQGSWYGFPCDSQGNPLPNNTYNNGFYTLYGPQSGTASNTYPLPMINAALAYPSLYGDYLYAATPSSYSGLGLSPHAVSVPGTANFPNDRVGAETPGFAFAGNYGGNGEGSYSVDAAHGGSRSGPIIGSVTADLSGQLVGYFKMYWSGPGPQPASAPFLVSTSLYAQAGVSYGNGRVSSGLSASAWATDGLFNERASASAGDGATSGGVSQVSGYHLVRAAVDPVTNIAEVYVNGVTHWSLSNMAPYATAGAAWASGGSLVQAGAIPDNRDVTISSNFPSPTYSKGTVDASHPTGQWANVRSSNGSMSDDTITPDASGTSAIYYPNYTGWGKNSTYNWTASLIPASGKPMTSTGVFNSTALFGNVTIPNFTGTYYNPPAADGSSDTISLSLKDGQDGAVGANTYTIHFHAPITNWKRLTIVRHPVALVKGTVNSPHPDWTYLMTIDNLSSQNLTQSITSAVSVSVTETTTMTGQQTLGAPSVAAFQANEGITNGKTYTYTYTTQSTFTYTTQSTFTGGPQALTQFYAAMSYEDRSGTCDIYAANGFQGTTTWFGRWSSGAVSSGSIEYPPQ